MTRPLNRDARNIATAPSNHPRPLNDLCQRPRRMLRWLLDHSAGERRTGLCLAIRQAYVRRNPYAYASQCLRAQKFSAAALIEGAGELRGPGSLNIWGSSHD